MSNSKNYNSILFITTLSVYFGLVLVGATPSVLAQQAALTQKFEISNEREIEDDLDKNPDDLLVSSIIDLVSELNEFSKKGIFDWDAKNDYQVENFRFCESDNLRSFMGGGTFKQQVFRRLDNNVETLARKLFAWETKLGLGDFHSHVLEFNLTSENKSLRLKFELKNENEKSPKVFADELQSNLNQITLKSSLRKKNVVAENTKITFENNQVFIVTNLPRAAIDELLADKDAK